MKTFRLFALWVLALASLAGLPAHGDRFEYLWGYADSEGADVKDVQVDSDGYIYILRQGDWTLIEQSLATLTWHVRKLDPDGQFLWEKAITMIGTGPYNERDQPALTIGLDGEVLVWGWFERYVTFDPAGAAVTMEGYETIPDNFNGMPPLPAGEVPEPTNDNYLMNLDGDGNLKWMVMVGTQHRVPRSYASGTTRVTMSPDGDIYYMTYQSIWTGQFDPLPLLVRHTNLSEDVEFPNDRNHSALLKLDRDGIPVWHRRIADATPGLEAEVVGMAVDGAGQLLLFGIYNPVFQSVVDFDPGPGTVHREYGYRSSNGSRDTYRHSRDLFLQRLTPDGTFLDLFTLTTNINDIARSHGLDAEGRGYVIAQSFDTESPPTMEYEGTGRDFPNIEWDGRDYEYGPFGVLRLGADGRVTDAQLLPHIASESGPLDYQLPRLYGHTPDPGLSFNWKTPVTPRGELCLTYWETRDPMETDPAIVDGAFHFVKFDTELRERWRASFEYPKTDYFRHYFARIGPDDTFYFASFAPHAMDIDPTDGVDMVPEPDPATQYLYIAKLQDVLEPDVLSIVRLDPSPTHAGTVTFRVSIDEPVTGVDISDFALTISGALTGATVTNVTGADGEYTVSVATGSGDGTIRLDLIDNDSISGVAEPLGGPGPDDFTDGEAYTMDYTGPMASFALPGSPYTVTHEATILVTFNEPVANVDANSFTVTNGVVTGVTGSGTDWVVTIDITAPGDATIDLAANGVTDTAGNGSGAGAGLSVTWLDFNGDSSVPGPVGWMLMALGFLALAMGVRRSRVRFGK